jgi:hypothetical protein
MRQHRLQRLANAKSSYIGLAAAQSDADVMRVSCRSLRQLEHIGTAGQPILGDAEESLK